MVEELHIELVGGPGDGAELVVPTVCDSCGEEIVPGSAIEHRGSVYVVGGNRAYAFFVHEVRRAA